MTTTRTCAIGRNRPQLDRRPVLLGCTPPNGFVFATVTSSDEESEISIAFRVDKGSEHGGVPSSYAYAILEGSGTPMPLVVDITWVAKASAGGLVRHVGRRRTP